jgi:hypothetical protein
MLEGARQEGTSDVAYSRNQLPVLKMTRNRSGKAERDPARAENLGLEQNN